MNTEETINDPILDEIHRIRRELVQEAGGDLNALGKWLMSLEEQHADRLVTLSPQPLQR